jgi:cbb3-type cytochrome oxidase maturation protein
MNYLVCLVPIALAMGLFGLLAFLWSMRSGQYEDLDGAAERVLLADAAEAPLRRMKSDDGVRMIALHEGKPRPDRRRSPEGKE